jgi:riboflavin kinase/FMN adenylyltransferase
VLVDRIRDGQTVAIGTGVANIGLRPTLDAGFSVEVHLFDFSQDLYGESLRVHLVSRLREERKFAGLHELKAQIEQDIGHARAALATAQPDPLAGGGWR